MSPEIAFPPPLSPRAVLVHVGMHKTGTTAMQTLFGENRDRLRELGVAYPGPRSDHHDHARAFTQRAAGPGGIDRPQPPAYWSALVHEVAAEPGRVLLSSEYFSSARDDQPARLVAELGPDRVHVLIGIRNTAASAVSAWQQTLKEGRVSDIGRWAAHNLPAGDRPPRDPAFWTHWDLGALVRRWAEAAGPGNVTAVVVDRTDRRRLPTTFERLLDLPAGMLADHPVPVTNRGMTAREAEFVRRLNRAVRDRLGWAEYRRFVRYGAIRAMVESVQPAPDEPRPVLPDWALVELRQAGRRAAEQIAASGVRVVGDLAELYAEDDRGAADAPTGADVPVATAVSAVLGAVDAASQLRPLTQIPARELVSVLGRRAGRRVSRTVRRVAPGKDEVDVP